MQVDPPLFKPPSRSMDRKKLEPGVGLIAGGGGNDEELPGDVINAECNR
jgi:hypothetical protein